MMRKWRLLLPSSRLSGGDRQYVRGHMHLLSGFFKRSMATVRDLQLQGCGEVLSVSNTEPLIDEIIQIRSEGLSPGEDVTLRVETSVGQKTTYFHSFGHFKADENGTVDLSRGSPVNGTYSCIDPMGLFWSIEEIDGQKPGTRILQRDTRQPLKMNLELYKGFVDFTVPVGAIPEIVKNFNLVEKVDLNRYYLSKDVERHEVRSGRLRETLFVPKNHSCPMPGVIDVFGETGGQIEFRAALLASHGFVTLALPCFGYDDLPRKVEEVEIEYFDETVDWFCQHPKVKPNSIGMIGTSKGGELSLLTATRKHEVKAVGGVSCPYFHIMYGIIIEGNLCACVPCVVENAKFTPEGFASTIDCYIDPDGDPSSKTAIPVENMIADVFLIGGEDDQCMAATKYARITKERMERHGKGHQCTTIAYPKAGHLIEPPYMPLCSRSFYTAYQVVVCWGGEKTAHAFAQKDSWERTILFFKEKLLD